MAADRELYIDFFAAIGRRTDAAATTTDGKQTAFALLKGIASGLGIAAGSGTAFVNGNPNILDDQLHAMGTAEDAPATDTGVWSAVSLAKGTLAGLL